MNEHSYIRSVHRHITKPAFVWKINDNYAGGVPDSYYCDKGGQLFVEYKYVPKLPKREDTLVIPALSGNQLIWLKERHMQNVAVAVVLGTPLGGIIFTDLTWERGIRCGDIEDRALPPKGVANIILDHIKGVRHVSHYGQPHNHSTRPEESDSPEALMECA